jgi:hypothetical protein
MNPPEHYRVRYHAGEITPRETVTGDIDGMGGLDAWGMMWLGAMDALQGWATPRVAP